jgi:hypothetical protein
MKTLPAPSFLNKHLQLYLVHETETTSTFQHGESLRNYLGRGRRVTIVYLLFFTMSLIAIRYIYPGSAIWKTMGLGFNNPVTHLFLFLWSLSMSWPFVFILYLLVKPSFVVWTFDRGTGKLEHFAANIFGVCETWYYSFTKIKSIDVTEHIEEDTRSSRYSKLTIVFYDDSKFMMSRSDYHPDLQQQEINYNHHLELAKNMRFRVGLPNPK